MQNREGGASAGTRVGGPFSLESLKCVRPKEETDEKGFCALSCFCGQPPAGVSLLDLTLLG